MSEDWLKIIKDKMESHEAPVPEGVWEKVESSIFPAKERGPRFMPWVWAFAAAAALALGVFAGLRLIDRGAGHGTGTDDEWIAENPTSPDNNNSSSADNGGGQVSPKVSPGVSPNVVQKREPVQIVPAPKGSSLAVVTDQDVPVEAVENVVEFPEIEMEFPEIAMVIPDSVLDLPESVVKVPAITKRVDTGFKTDHDGEDWSDYLSVTSDYPDSRRLSAGLSLSSAARGAQDANMLDTKTFFHGVAASYSDIATRDASSIYTRTVSVPVSKSEDHKRPVRLALSLDFPVTDVLSVESGLTYSMLQSDFTTSSGTRSSQETQTLGYLGIPLNLKANIWNKDWFTVYAAGGGMVEKCVNASSKTVVTLSGESSGSPVKNKFSVKPLMWSLNASAGLQANIPGSMMGLYLEPGVSYHFAGNTKYHSIYTEHPFDFIMSFGLRYSFR
ncbi:MAG: hypothetical protein IKW89_14425 [Bacteroidales bacterium]|nr:hypothetical protein [Bacteroidales bacterium]